MIPDPSDRDYSGEQDFQLHDVLTALGFRARERVSINTQLPGGRFVSELHEVRNLAGWTPPQDRNVWWGVNPVGRQVRYGRGTEADVTRVRVLFTDFDIKNLATLSQCYTAAGMLADYCGAGAVAMVESGHGLQPIWRVGSPPGDSNVIDRDRSRDECKAIYQRWGAVAARKMRIDNVFNLDRILRCPGSVNWKNADDPVPVCTEVFNGQRIRLRDLVARLDRDGVTPLASLRTALTALPTSFGEADEWIHDQPGATLERAALEQLTGSPVLWQYLDTAELTRAIGNGPREAHTVMRDQVWHAVLAAQEGSAGLVLALHNIGAAYLEVMEARADGRLSGEVRDSVRATREWADAVRGAVAKARGRKLPDLDAWARKAFDDD